MIGPAALRHLGYYPLWMRLAIASLCAGCTAIPVTQPTVERIEPASAVNTGPTRVQIEGSAFHLPITNDIDLGRTTAGALMVSLGDIALEDAVLIDEGHIEGTVPAGLAAGVYDVALALGSNTDTLPSGFTVLALGAFSAPTPVTALSSSAADDDPTMTADHLELYFNSNRAGGMGGADIWISTRASATDPWGPPAPVVPVNSTTTETTPGVSADGLTLYFSSDRAGGLGGTDIYVSTRATRADAWTVPAHVGELASVSAEHGTQPSASGRSLVFNSDRSGSTLLYITTRASLTAPWDAPRPITELSSGDEADPTLVAEDQVIVFHSTTRGGGVGGSELYLARRAAPSLPFDAPVPIPELNSPASDSDAWLSDDQRHALFASDRSGTSQIYEASRTLVSSP